MGNRATFGNASVCLIKNKMSTRSSRILNMVLPKTENSIHPRKQKPDQDCHIPKESKKSPIYSPKHSHSLFSCEPIHTDSHNDSFETDSIPDSQPDHDLDNILFYDTNERDLECPKKTNKVIVEESSSDCDGDFFNNNNEKDSECPKKLNKVVQESSSDFVDDSSSSSDSDSESTEDAFSSDDSVKDPDYQIKSPAEPDSDNNSTRFIKSYNFSPKPGSSGACNIHSSSSEYIVMKAQTSDNQPAVIGIQPANVDSQPTSVDTQPPSVDAQPASIDSQPLSIDAQPAEADTQPPSVDTQPASVDTQPTSVGAQSPCVITDFQHRARKRKANPELWKKNQSKLLKNSGKSYTSLSKSKKLFDAKKMGPVCTDKCKLKCSTKFRDEERMSIFEDYWATADLYTQRQFVYEHMSEVTPKYRYRREGSNRKNLNHAFYFSLNETRVRVCKIFFMHTLAISDKFIRTVKKKHSNLIGTQTKDNRGRHGSHNKTDTHLIDGIKAHINSIPRIESHYCRAQSKREYIEGGTNVTALHRDYVEKCKSEGIDYASYQIYYGVFKNDFNISFWQPKKDQCDDCNAYANAEDKKSLQLKYELHLKEKSLARAEKEKDKENVSDTFIVAVYDLQAVMPCPRGDISSFYYISKVNLLNFTITELITKNTICFVWHEGEGARGVNELGSCVFMYLKTLHDKANEAFDVVFYSDNCCGQQKNKFMLAMYQHAIREFPKLRSITHKFLIKGHTQNEGDSVHSVIGRNISNALKSSPIFVPDQYITLIKTAKKKGTPYNVKELTHDSFFDLKPLAVGNYNVTEHGEKLKWTDIKVLKIDQGNQNKFFFKTSYDDTEFKSVSTLTKKQAKSNTVVTTTLKKLYAQKLKVPSAKTKGILNLIEKNVIPKYYEVFYSNL